MAKKLKNPTRQELLSLEREVLGFNITSIVGEHKFKIFANGYKGVKYIFDAIDFEEDCRNVLMAGVITNIEHKQSNSGNYFYWIYISDDFSSVKLYCNEKTFTQFNKSILKDRCVLFNVSVKNGFASFDKCRLIDNIPLTDKYVFVIHQDFDKYSTTIKEFIEDEIGISIRNGNVEVLINTMKTNLFIDPSYELCRRIESLYGIKCTIEKEDDYLWGNTKRDIEEYERNNYWPDEN